MENRDRETRGGKSGWEPFSTMASFDRGWKKCYSERRGCAYWFNTNTGESRWEDPEKTVQQHYDNRKLESKSDREQSQSLYVRNFNNWIKMVILSEACKKCNGRNDNRLAVIDLACGQGGDLSKYEHLPVWDYIGIDISPVLIERAQERYKDRRFKFGALFYASDLSRPLSFTPGLCPGERHLASMQFALHYFASSQEAMLTLLQTVSTYLAPGGLFVGTTVDKNALAECVRNKNKRKNPLLQLEHDESFLPSLEKNPTPWGVGYKFTLVDAVDHLTEYVVDRTLLEKEAARCKLTLKEWTPFNQYYYNHANNYMGLFQKVVAEKSTPADAWEVVTLYSVFVFEKQQ